MGTLIGIYVDSLKDLYLLYIRIGAYMVVSSCRPYMDTLIFYSVGWMGIRERSTVGCFSEFFSVSGGL